MLTATVHTHTSPFVEVGVDVPAVAGAATFSGAEEARLSAVGAGTVGSTGGAGRAENVRSIVAASCGLAAVGKRRLWTDWTARGRVWNGFNCQYRLLYYPLLGLDAAVPRGN